MAADSPANSSTGLPKWQIALAVGAPIAVGVAVGAYYYRRPRSKGADTKEEKAATPGNTATSTANSEPKKEEKTPEEKAQALKNKGNKYFKATQYDQAIKCYNEAIEIAPKSKPKDLSTFYQNRAAAHEQLKNYAQVVTDCSQALELNPRYVKALFRRAKAYEMMNQKMQCLEDTTAVCILETFAHQPSMMLADKMLKEIGKEKAQNKYKERVPSLPSGQFVRSYFSSFSNDGISHTDDDYNSEENNEELSGYAKARQLFCSHNYDGIIEHCTEEIKTNGPMIAEAIFIRATSGSGEVIIHRSGYAKARQLFCSHNYDGIIEHCTEEIETNGPMIAEAILMRATFYLLMGQANEAKPDLDRLIGMEDSPQKLRANALIKRGSMHMQEGNSTEAMSDFATAVRIDPDNQDIYHHRGQLNLLLEQIDDAARDFEKCTKLKEDFALAHAQHSYAKYRLAILHQSPMQMQAAMQMLEECTRKFPTCAEAFALFAQAQSDQGQFQQADENFQKATALEPDNPTAYVHRGLLHLTWKKDANGSLGMIKKALEIDSKCDFAYETLGTIEVQRGNMNVAKEYFEKAIELARTEMEMVHLYSLCVAAEAQNNVTKKYNITPPSALNM